MGRANLDQAGAVSSLTPVATAIPHGAPPPQTAADAPAQAGERPASLTFQWHDSLAGLASTWSACFPPDAVLSSYALHQAVEAAQLDEVAVHYLVGRDGRGRTCLLPCFAFRVSLVSIAQPWIQRLVSGMRWCWPSFLQVRLFVVGTPLSSCSELLGFGEHAGGPRFDEAALRQVFAEVERKAGSLGIALIVVKEFDSPMRDRLHAALGRGYLFVDSLPTTYLPLPRTGKGGYLTAIRSKYRNKLKHRISIGAASSLRWEICRDASRHAAAVHALYLQVLSRSQARFEQLNEDFFRRALAALPERAFLLLGFAQIDGSERLVASELVLCDRGVLHPIYSGFDYAYKERTALYFNTFYRLIEEAERRGCRALHIGQTAYEVKAELGALAHPLHLAVRHRNALVQRHLTWARAILFPQLAVPYRAVFAKPAEAFALLAGLGIVVTRPRELDGRHPRD
jgi:hypothetical protein